MTRAIMAERLDLAPAGIEVMIGARTSQAPGKPYVPGGPSFSIAHAGEHVLVAVVDGEAATASVSIGVDVESTRPAHAHLADLLDAAPPGERPERGWTPESFTRSWVRREAVLKAVGTGLLAPRDDLLLSPADGSAAVVRSGGALPSPRHLALDDLDLTAAPSTGRSVPVDGGGEREEHLAAVALCAPEHHVALGAVTLADGLVLLARHGLAGP
jgi:4'-phosphopantetheinyl transferase